MNCEVARELAALAASGDTTAAEMRGLEAHLAGCADCRAEAEGFRALCGQLAGMRKESVPEAVYAAVRARVLAKVGARGRSGWRVVCAGLAAVVACSLILMVALRPVVPRNTVVSSVEPPPMDDRGAEKMEEPGPGVLVRHVHRVSRRVVPNAVPADAEPLVVKMITDDPDVIIYWIADGKGRSQGKEIVQ